MSLQEMQKEIEQQKAQQLGPEDGDTTEPPVGRKVSVHDHHPSVALLEKAENHVERRKQALLAHAGYQVDPKWWDNKLKLIKKAQQAHHKVVNSISYDMPQISVGLSPHTAQGLQDLRYDSSEDENENTVIESSVIKHETINENETENKSEERRNETNSFHTYDVSGTEIYKGDPITPRFGKDEYRAGLKITNFDESMLNEDERKQFEQQRKQLEKVLKDFDLLLKNYENATANLEVLSKIAFEKQDRKSDIKELDDKFTAQLNAQNEKINTIGKSVSAIADSVNEMKEWQSNALSNIESQIKETKNLQTTLIERETVTKTESIQMGNQSKQQTQDNSEFENKLNQLITTVNQSFTQISNEMKNMSQSFNKNFNSLSEELENVSSMQQQLQQGQERQNSKQLIDTPAKGTYKSAEENSPLLNGGQEELEPKEYVLKRQWCCGLVCFTNACGIGTSCC